jgi:UDP-N-acetylmuramate dehydrogenase
MAVKDIMGDFPERFLGRVGRPLRQGVPLKGASNFRIGGPADFFFEAGTAGDLRAAMDAARESGVRCYVMGGGFNLLFDDAGYRGLLIKVALRGMAAETATESGFLFRTAAGESAGDLLKFVVAHGCGGLEFLAGIPGTVGGAVFGNAGAFGRAVGDVLEDAFLLGADGREFRSGREHFEFSYRHSKLKARHDILLEARFRLRPGDPLVSEAKIAEYMALRAEKHPPRETAYAGSYFKNPAKQDGTRFAAGYLLEQVGARGMRFGGAAVSACHCNFLVNEADASARDVLALAAELKARVKAKFRLDLEEEVIFLPADGPSL